MIYPQQKAELAISFGIIGIGVVATVSALYIVGILTMFQTGIASTPALVFATFSFYYSNVWKIKGKKKDLA